VCGVRVRGVWGRGVCGVSVRVCVAAGVCGGGGVGWRGVPWGAEV